MLQKYFKVSPVPFNASIALLLLRLVVGLAFVLHGFGKIGHPMNWMGPESRTPGILQACAAIAEFCGGLAWIAGLLVPLASVGIAGVMAVAIHSHLIVRGDPFVGNVSSYELA